MTTFIIELLLGLWTAYLLVCAAYLWTLVLAAAGYRALRPAQNLSRRVTLLVPAHDEAEGVAATLASISALRYPNGLLRTVIIADNCSDATAAVVRGLGFEVLERTDADHPGKGQALAWAMATLQLPPGEAAVAILDADCTVTAGWLEQAHAYLDHGFEAVQASYGLQNGGDSRGARIAEVGLMLFNHVRPAGRARLGMSAGLNGSGMVFSADLLRRIPWRAGSVTEDLEYASTLAAAGVVVGFDSLTKVDGLGGIGAAASTQRARWEGGRFTAIRTLLPGLLRSAPTGGGRSALGAALDLLVLPLGLLVLLGTAWTAAGILAFALAGLPGTIATLPAVALLLVLATVPAGLLAAGADRRLYWSLLLAPAYVAWKIPIYARLFARRGGREWVRTARRRHA